MKKRTEIILGIVLILALVVFLALCSCNLQGQNMKQATLIVDKYLMDDFPYTGEQIISSPYYEGLWCSADPNVGTWCMDIEVICLKYANYYPHELEFTCRLSITDTILRVHDRMWFPVWLIQGKHKDMAILRIIPHQNHIIKMDTSYVYLNWISNIALRKKKEPGY